MGLIFEIITVKTLNVKHFPFIKLIIRSLGTFDA